MDNTEFKNTFSKNLNQLMKLRHVSRCELCDATGVKYTTLTDWIKGNTYPRIDKIELLASFSDVSKSELIENHSISLTDTEISVLHTYRNLDPESRCLFDRFLIFLSGKEMTYEKI